MTWLTSLCLLPVRDEYFSAVDDCDVSGFAQVVDVTVSGLQARAEHHVGRVHATREPEHLRI